MLAPVNSFEFQPCGRTPQVGHLTGYLRHWAPKDPTPSAHRLRLGLPGYLILFAPLAFASQRQKRSSESPSPLVFLPISTDFTLTPGIPFASPVLKPRSFGRSSTVKPWDFTPDLRSRLLALYTQ